MIETYRNLMSRFHLLDVRRGERLTLSPTLVSQYEAALGHRIPQDYLAFADEFGFKMPNRTTGGYVLFSLWNEPDVDCGGVDVFFGMAGDTSDDNDVLANIEMIAMRARDLAGDEEWRLTDSTNGDALEVRDFLPFALCAGMPLVLKVAGFNQGAVYFFDMESWRMDPISRSFEEFLRSLHVVPL